MTCRRFAGRWDRNSRQVGRHTKAWGGWCRAQWHAYGAHWAARSCGTSMRQTAIFVLVLVLGGSAVVPVRAQDRDDFLRVYAIKVIHNRPFKEPFIGLGVYVGRGV